MDILIHTQHANLRNSVFLGIVLISYLKYLDS